MMDIERLPSDNAVFDRVIGRIHENRALQKLNEVAKEVTGFFLVILVRTDSQMVEIHPAEADGGLPRFCKAYRSTAQGQTQCRTCRSLVALGACYHGLIEHACHGGVSVVASPVIRKDGTRSEHLVVASCAYVQDSYAQGWPLARKHALDLGTDMKELKRAYHELPVLSEEKRLVARGITDAAASVLGEIEEELHRDCRGSVRALVAEERSCDKDLEGLLSNLGEAGGPLFQEGGQSAGLALVNLVVAMVKRDPSMPYSVTNIARVARLTPNHFSMLFSKHTGEPFRVFLSGQRIRFALDLLRDLNLDIAEVAHRSGFVDPAYFSRRLKQVTGSTPTAWRCSPAAPKNP
jgi:AraC-like DNA-binding protein